MEFIQLDWLGGGGEASVYRAYSPDDGRFYALKVPHLPWMPEARWQIYQEGRRRLQARSPHIVNLVDWNLDAAEPYLALEYADGGTVGAAIKFHGRNGRVCDARYALEITRDVLHALAAVHSRNLIHRDVKPDNVCWFSSGEIALNDFGLGRTLTRPLSLQTRSFCGTQLYAAPEQKIGMSVDHRADIYSCGVMLYELLTGEVPTSRPTDWTMPSMRRMEITPRVDQYLRWLLAEDPMHRPATASIAAEVASDLIARYSLFA